MNSSLADPSTNLNSLDSLAFAISPRNARSDSAVSLGSNNSNSSGNYNQKKAKDKNQLAPLFTIPKYSSHQKLLTNAKHYTELVDLKLRNASDLYNINMELHKANKSILTNLMNNVDSSSEDNSSSATLMLLFDRTLYHKRPPDDSNTIDSWPCSIYSNSHEIHEELLSSEFDAATARIIITKRNKALSSSSSDSLILDSTAKKLAKFAAETSEQRLKRYEHRRLRIQEILSTEKTYVKKLLLIINSFAIPLKQQSDVLTSAQSNTLFNNVELLYQFNSKLLTDIQSRAENWNNDSCIGDLFVQFAPFFRMYASYAANHEFALNIMNKLEKDNSKFQKLLKQTAAEGVEDLHSLLISPIQRIPRYLLLLRDVESLTEPSHADIPQLQKALQLIDESMIHVNEAVRRRENNDTIIKLQSQFASVVHFISPGRILKLQCSLNIKKGEKRPGRYEFFVFNDLLAYADTNILGKFNPPKQFTIENSFSIALLPDGFIEADKNCVQLMNHNNPLLVLQAKDHDTKYNFYSTLKQSIEQAKSSANSFEAKGKVQLMKQSSSNPIKATANDRLEVMETNNNPSNNVVASSPNTKSIKKAFWS
jgi:hypothetical protein